MSALGAASTIVSEGNNMNRRRTARGFSRRRLDYISPRERFMRPFLLTDIEQFMQRWGVTDNSGYDVFSDLVALDVMRRSISALNFTSISKEFVANAVAPQGKAFIHQINEYPAFQLLFVQRVYPGENSLPADGHVDFLRGFLPTDAMPLCKYAIKHPSFTECPVEVVPIIQTGYLPTENEEADLIRQHISTLSETTGEQRYRMMLDMITPLMTLIGTVESDDYNQYASRFSQIDNRLNRDSIVTNEASSVHDTDQGPLNRVTRYAPYILNRRRPVNEERESTSVRQTDVITPRRTENTFSRLGDQRRVHQNICQNIEIELCALTAARDLDSIKRICEFSNTLKEILQQHYQ